MISDKDIYVIYVQKPEHIEMTMIHRIRHGLRVEGTGVDRHELRVRLKKELTDLMKPQEGK